jgi:hypothetical protein
MQGAKRHLIRRILIGFGVIAVLVPAVIYLNDNKIGLGRPSALQPSTGDGTPSAVVVARPAPMPAQATTPRPAEIREPSAAPRQPGAVTPPATDPNAAASQASPDLPPSLSGLLTDTLDTVDGATSALDQLLTAEEAGVVTTWCSLATTLDIAHCESELGTQWAEREAQSDVGPTETDSVTVSQALGSGAQYTYCIYAGAKTAQVTMVWSGRQWRLSDQDYQQALAGGGILTPLLGSLTSAVLNLL